MFILDYKIDKRLFKLRDYLVRLYKSQNNTCNTQSKNEKLSNVISCFLLNSYYKGDRHSFGITLHKSSYSKSRVVNGRSTGRKVSHSYMISFLKFLEDNDFIELCKGRVLEWGVVGGMYGVSSTQCSYVNMKKSLISLYKSHDSGTETTCYKLLDSVIVSRGDIPKAGDLTFKMTPYHKEVRDILSRYNKVSLNFEVESNKGRHDVQMYKIYRGKLLDKNGRSYMKGEGIQQLSSSDRKDITIDGDPVVIYDYSCFEPSIAYSLSGEDRPEDPYCITLEGYDKDILRSIAKRCMLIMLNIKDKDTNSVRTACNGVVRESFDIDRLVKEGKVPERVDVMKICELLDQKNYLIRDYFYGNGVHDTAYIGGAINDYITDYFSQRGILVLSVFDEFIVQEKYEKDLIKVMQNAYQLICGDSVNCKISKEK